MRVSFLALLLSTVGCGTVAVDPADAPEPGETTPEPTARVNDDPPVPVPKPEEEELVIIEPGKVVPPFKVTSLDGTVFDSQEIVGKQPFVVVFFASWCSVCEKKLPIVKETLEKEGGSILTIGVAMDAAETWDKVEGYISRHGLAFDVVRAEEHRRFATAYDPFGSVPVIVVVDRTGIIAEVQRGHKAEHVARLAEALRTVK
jgi:peroxiredoxin